MSRSLNLHRVKNRKTLRAVIRMNAGKNKVIAAIIAGQRKMPLGAIVRCNADGSPIVDKESRHDHPSQSPLLRTAPR